MTFAHNLETALNALESEEYEVYDVMEVPGEAGGILVVGRKPRRFPASRKEA